ncbi:hypothetical protein K8R61_01110, partial [bacterium]|nr:hypothetical protein [bacterium]
LVEKMQDIGIKMQRKEFKKIKLSNGSYIVSAGKVWNSYKNTFNDLDIGIIIAIIRGEITGLDRYITMTKPWEMIKNKDKRVGIIMYFILERLRHIAWMLLPFMSDTAEKIWESLGLDIAKEREKEFSKAIKWGGLDPKSKIKKSKPLFPRIN